MFQWTMILGILVIIALDVSMCLFMHVAKEEKATRIQVCMDGLAMVYLFLLQQGAHPDARHLSRRLLSLTTSMLTLLVFIYYANDITAKMTSGPPNPHPVRTFGDVLVHGYKVIVAGNYAWQMLQRSPTESAKHKVFKHFFEESEETILQYEKMALGEQLEDKTIEQLKDDLPHWYHNTNENYEWAQDTIIDEQKTLWYCPAFCDPPRSRGKIKALKMDDSVHTHGGHVLHPDSEYLSVFNHYLLKEYEHGILNRLDKSYNGQPDIKIGMSEPDPLGINNVMFPFSLLGAAIIMSVIISVVEKAINKIMVSMPAHGRAMWVKRNNELEDQKMKEDK